MGACMRKRFETVLRRSSRLRIWSSYTQITSLLYTPTSSNSSTIKLQTILWSPSIFSFQFQQYGIENLSRCSKFWNQLYGSSIGSLQNVTVVFAEPEAAALDRHLLPGDTFMVCNASFGAVCLQKLRFSSLSLAQQLQHTYQSILVERRQPQEYFLHNTARQSTDRVRRFNEESSEEVRPSGNTKEYVSCY